MNAEENNNEKSQVRKILSGFLSLPGKHWLVSDLRNQSESVLEDNNNVRTTILSMPIFFLSKLNWYLS